MGHCLDYRCKSIRLVSGQRFPPRTRVSTCFCNTHGAEAVVESLGTSRTSEFAGLTRHLNAAQNRNANFASHALSPETAVTAASGIVKSAYPGKGMGSWTVSTWHRLCLSLLVQARHTYMPPWLTPELFSSEFSVVFVAGTLRMITTFSEVDIF